MDKIQLTEFKSFYENAIIDKLAEALHYNKNQFTAQYSIDKLSVHINLTTSHIVTIYDFTYCNNNLTMDMESYKILYSERNNMRAINGIQSQKITIDLNTIGAIARIFEQVLSMDIPNCCGTSEETITTSEGVLEN